MQLLLLSVQRTAHNKLLGHNMGNGLRCGKAAGNYTLLPGSCSNRSFNVFFAAGLAGIGVVAVLFHNEANGLDAKLFYHFHPNFRKSIPAGRTYQSFSFQTVFHHLGGNSLWNAVQRVFVLFAALVRGHNSSFFLRILCEYLCFIEQKTQLLGNRFIALFRGCPKLLVPRKPQCFHKHIHTLFKRRDTSALRLKFFVFRTGNGDRFRVACSAMFCVFHTCYYTISTKKTHRTNSKKQTLLKDFQTADRLVCFRLVYTQTLHEPAILLRCQHSGFTLISGPLKAAPLQSLVQQHKAVALPVQSLDPVPPSVAEQKQRIGKGIQ